MKQWHKGDLDPNKYKLVDGILFYKNRILLIQTVLLSKKILYDSHNSPSGGHAGFHKTLYRIKRSFHWKHLNSDAREFVRQCDICQRCKYDPQHPQDLLQPLPIPDQI